MAVKTIKDKDLIWYDITEPNENDISFLKENFRFHPLDIKDVRSSSEHPKVDVYRNYLFIIFHYPEFNKETQNLDIKELSVFLGHGYLVTIQKSRIKPIKDSFFRCLNNPKLKKEYLGRDSGYLLYKLLESFFSSIYNVTDNFKKQVQVLEDQIFSVQKKVKLRSSIIDLALLKRNILNLKLTLTPQRSTITSLEHVRNDYLPQEMIIYFDDVLDSIERLLVLSDTYRENVQGLSESAESLISLTTNKTINILTTISVALMPLTLLSGIYGMNISLPFSGNPIFIWMMYMVLGVVGVIGLIYLNKQGRL